MQMEEKNKDLASSTENSQIVKLDSPADAKYKELD